MGLEFNWEQSDLEGHAQLIVKDSKGAEQLQEQGNQVGQARKKRGKTPKNGRFYV
jgi:hypothetical protein